MSILDLPSPKLTSASQEFYPYYAGFSSAFARAAVAALDADKVLDPFNGSGTTTFASRALGKSAIGLDLNPFACVLASARLATRPEIERAMETISTPSHLNGDASPLTEWLGREDARDVAAMTASLVESSQYPAAPWTDRSASAGIIAIALATKGIRHIRKGTNPTWIRPGGSSASRTNLRDRVVDELRLLAASAGPTTETMPSCTIANVDACDSGIPDGSVGAIITSPPYCTRMDYVISTSFELAILGLHEHSQGFRTLRDRMIGTPTIRRVESAEQPQRAEAVELLLDRVKSHPSYAAKGYYHKQMAQYFDDSARFLREARRVLKPGGVALVVVQSSHFKDVEIDLPRLWAAMGTDAGFAANDGPSFPVRRVIADLNPRAVRGRRYREAVVHLQLPPAR